MVSVLQLAETSCNSCMVEYRAVMNLIFLMDKITAIEYREIAKVVSKTAVMGYEMSVYKLSYELFQSTRFKTVYNN
jgi:hypothetical protein